MSEKELYELENLLEKLDSILQNRLSAAVEPMRKQQDFFIKLVSACIVLATSIIGYIFVRQEWVNEKLSEKSTKTELTDAHKERERDYLKKLDFYKLEIDEHKKIQECFISPSRIPFVISDINEHIMYELNLNIGTTRGGISK